jgi:hypothetical protein
MSYAKTVTEDSFRIVCTGIYGYEAPPTSKFVYLWNSNMDDYNHLVRIITQEFYDYGLVGSNNDLIIKHYDDDTSLYFQANGPKGRKFIKHLKEKGVL